MEKMTQKAIRGFVQRGLAIDLTHKSSNELYEMQKVHHFEQVAYAAGIYGINAALYRDENGTIYAITCRSTALFCL